MFRIIYPNRWLIWAVVISLVTAMLLYWAIALYSIELRWDPASDSISDVLRNFKKMRLERGGVSDWKTYRNEQYGFEIGVPGSWNFEEINTTDANNAPTKNFSLTAPNFTRINIAPAGVSFYPNKNPGRSLKVSRDNYSIKRDIFLNEDGSYYFIFDKIENDPHRNFVFLLSGVNAKDFFTEDDLRVFDNVLTSFHFIK